MRILIADNGSNVRVGLQLLLEQEPEIKVVDSVADVTGLLDRVGVLCPDLLLLGWELAGRNGAKLIHELREICPCMSIIVLAVRSDLRSAILDAGADAFVSKAAPPERLVVAIACVRRDRSPPHTRDRHLGDA